MDDGALLLSICIGGYALILGSNVGIRIKRRLKR
jgi:hypothetical protein